MAKTKDKEPDRPPGTSDLIGKDFSTPLSEKMKQLDERIKKERENNEHRN